jgi:MFS family permease
LKGGLYGGSVLRLHRRLPPALRERDFSLLWIALLGSGLASQMVQVAVGWQVYSLHHSALDLALIGLAEFLPLPLLALPAGHVADRIPRALVFGASLVAQGLVTALLLMVTIRGAHELWPFIALAAATGAAGAFGNPAARALPPELVSFDVLASAMALRSIAFQVAGIGGPALGGLLFAVSPTLLYAVGVFLVAGSLVATLLLRRPDAAARAGTDEPPDLDSLLGGVAFVRRTPIILGSISLDLFAVLFGGAVALLPLYAQSILHTGPFGLGILRSGPALGALVAGVLLARRPLGGRVGRTLLVVVGAFGVCMVVFGFSRWFPLSLAALIVSGFVDMFSMTIRSTTVALATPNELLGRVNAVEWTFISASNELGAFESGAAAALLGAVPAVVAGGLLTIALALVWGRVFPALAEVDRLEDVHPELANAG